MDSGPAMAPAAWPGARSAAAATQDEMRWHQLDSGVSAVSFGFVATAILVSMFLAMAILEHFLRAPARARGMGMGPPFAPPPPRGGILFRLRILLLRCRGAGAGGEASFPGSDLEAARKLDGRASPEVWHTGALLPHAPPPKHAVRASLLMIPSSRPFRNFPFSHRLARFFALCVCAFDGPKLPIISPLPIFHYTRLGYDAAMARSRRHLTRMPK
jgi:hypothetical protein